MVIRVKKEIIIQASLLIIAFVFFYQKAIFKLVSDWSTDPNFSHGFLIPFVSIYMVWYKQNEIKEIVQKPSSTGIALIVFGMLVHLVGNLGSELFLMRFSMIITLSGMIIYYFGFRMFKAVSVPIMYLIMMIPIPYIIWNKIAFPLQLFSAGISSQAIDMLQIPVFREGNILHLANTSLEVVDACSGIRSLTSLLALTSAFSFISPLSRVNKWILFLSAIPIAVAVNVIRLTITGAMAAWISPETAHGFLHDMSGFVVFGAALVMVYLVFIVQMRFEKIKTAIKH